MQYLIGVDAGGTRVTADAYSIDGALIESVEKGAGNLTVSFEKGMENIKLAIDAITSKRPNDELKYIVVGAAGIETGDLKSKAADKLRALYGDRVYVTNDAETALVASLEDKDGILIIAGTGSIGYLKKGDIYKRCGGWGHLIGDGGSGYSIAMEAVRDIMKAHDNEAQSDFTIPILKATNSKNEKELTQFIYKSQKTEIAALSFIVTELAQKGSKKAEEILLQAGEQLAELAITLWQVNKLEAPKITISGSILKKDVWVRESFKRALNNEKKPYSFANREFHPTKAVYYIYNRQ